MISAEFIADKEDYSFEDILQCVQTSLKEQMNKVSRDMEILRKNKKNIRN